MFETKRRSIVLSFSSEKAMRECYYHLRDCRTTRPSNMSLEILPTNDHWKVQHAEGPDNSHYVICGIPDPELSRITIGFPGLIGYAIRGESPQVIRQKIEASAAARGQLAAIQVA